MVKKQVGRKEYIKVGAFVVIATVAIFAVVAFIVTRGSSAPSVSMEKRGDESIVKGLAVCLPHKDTEGPQTMECAIGIKDSQGIYYSLNDTNNAYLNVGQIQTGKRYQVTGMIEERADATYDTAGIIRINTVKEL